MTDTFRALFAELLDWAERTTSHYYKQPDVIIRARAALAQPEPVAPVSDSEMAAYNDRAAARFAILDRLEKAIDFNSNGGWLLTPEGEHWQRIMDEQGRDEYEMGI